MAVGTYGITAIDCDLLPDVLHMQFFGHRRLLALQVTTPINVMSRPLVLTDTTRLSCQAKKLVYCKGPRVQLPLSPKFAVKESHTNSRRASSVYLY